MIYEKPIYNHVVTVCGVAHQEKYGKWWRNIIERNRSTRRIYEYIRDRVSGECKLPSLAQLIREKSGSTTPMNEALP